MNDLRLFFNLLYNGRHVRDYLREGEPDVVMHLYQLAAYFNVRWLMLLCEQDLIRSLGTLHDYGDVETVLDICDFAVRRKAGPLWRAVLFRMGRSIKVYGPQMTTEQWSQLSKDDVVYMLKARGGLLDAKAEIAATLGTRDVDRHGNVLLDEDAQVMTGEDGEHSGEEDNGSQGGDDEGDGQGGGNEDEDQDDGY